MNTMTINFKKPSDLSDRELTAETTTLDGVVPLLSERIADLARRNALAGLSPQETDLMGLLATVAHSCRTRLHDISIEQQARAVMDPNEDDWARMDPLDRHVATWLRSMRDSQDKDEACTGDEEDERHLAARRIIADYMGVRPDDVHIICSCACADGDTR